MRLIWVKRETENFLRRDWTTQITLIARAFSALCRTLRCQGDGPGVGLRAGAVSGASRAACPTRPALIRSHSGPRRCSILLTFLINQGR
jgi:hypothetical protein